MKRKSYFFVVLLLCLAMLSVCSVLADDDLYPKSGTCGDNITWEITNNDTTLTLSGTGEMYNYEWADYAKYHWAISKITTIVINEGITSIGSYAFSEFDYVSEITIPKTVKSIGKCAFNYSRCLAKVVLNEGIESIGDSAFSQCFALEQINLPDTITSIGTRVFQYCSKLKSITIPSGITDIPDGLCYECTGLESVVLHDGIETIGEHSFQKCSSLKSISIPDGLKSIGLDAFNNCTSLEAIYIRDLAAWCQISFSYNPLNYAENLYLNGKLISELIIPESVTVISSGAFSGEKNIKSITVHDGVTEIGSNAFMCSSLEEITLPFIGKSRTAVATDSEDFSDTIVHIFGYTLNVDVSSGSATIIPLIPENLKKITVTDDTKIGNSAFDGCSNVTSVVLAEKIKSIESYAFYDCKSLTDVYYMGKEKEWEEISIGSGNTYLLNATIHCLGRDEVEISAEAVNDSINVSLTNAREGDCVIFILYNSKAFVGVKAIEYTGAQISYPPEVECDEAKIVVWESLDSLSPLATEVEKVNI